jgi:hypothetical protein
MKDAGAENHQALRMGHPRSTLNLACLCVQMTEYITWWGGEGRNRSLA